jgi:hypothetical protein
MMSCHFEKLILKYECGEYRPVGGNWMVGRWMDNSARTMNQESGRDPFVLGSVLSISCHTRHGDKVTGVTEMSTGLRVKKLSCFLVLPLMFTNWMALAELLMCSDHFTPWQWGWWWWCDYGSKNGENGDDGGDSMVRVVSGIMMMVM